MLPCVETNGTDTGSGATLVAIRSSRDWIEREGFAVVYCSSPDTISKRLSLCTLLERPNSEGTAAAKGRVCSNAAMGMH